MNYSKHTFLNGLRLITIPMPAMASATVMILVGVGSRYEIEEKNGVTHFLEHMLFKGTKKWPQSLELSQQMDMIGGESNAATGKESTAYYIKTPSVNLKRAFEILCDMVQNPLLKKDEIEREKEVIVSEIAMYEDTPMRRVGEVFETLLYPASALGWDITGTAQTVRGMTRDDFLKLRKDFYHPQNMVVVVSGGIKEKEVMKLVEKYLGNLKFQITKHKLFDKLTISSSLSLRAEGLSNVEGQIQNSKSKIQKETFIQQEPRVLVKEKKTDQAHLVLGFRGNARGNPDRFVEEILATILGEGKSSMLWIELREKLGLAYHVQTDVSHYLDNGYLSTYAGIAPGKIEQALEKMMKVLDNLKKGQGITKQTLIRAKEYIKGHLSLSLEDTRTVAGFFGSFELLENKVLTPEEINAGIDKVEVDDVLRVAEEFLTEERSNLAVIGPYRDGEKFKRILRC